MCPHLFPSKSCQRARLVLFASLVLPLFDYSAAVVHPQLKTLNDAMEKTVNTFLKSNNLGESQGLSSEEKYCSRLMQLGMEPLVIRRLRSALLLAYKLVFRKIPLGEYLFESFVSVASALSVAGNTRTAHLRLQHPHPIQAVKKSATMPPCSGTMPPCGRLVAAS